MSKKPQVLTRGATDHFLIGQSQNNLDSGGKLPVSRKILQYLKFLQSLPGQGGRPVKSIISCPFSTGTVNADCKGQVGCSSRSEKCVVSAVTEYWGKAGIPTLTHQAISDKVFKLLNEWKQIVKDKSKSSVAVISKREAFVKKLDTLFDIAAKNAIEVIQGDRLRSAEARQSDNDFYLDQKGERIGYMSSLDEVYKNTVEKKKKREEEEMKRKEALQKSDSLDREVEVDEGDEREPSDDDSEDFVGPTARRPKKPETVPLLVPRNIVETVALNSKRFKLSDVATASNIALIVNESNGNLDDFIVSTSTVRRRGISAVKNNAEEIKNCFKSSLSSKDLTLHFDGKSVKEFTGGQHLEQERIAIIVTSPTLEHPQVLGVPPAESSKGVDQQQVVENVLEEWGLKEHIMALGFDTTASNTGVHAGAVTLIEKYLGRACMWSACQRHIHELHIKHAAEFVFGPTSGPSDKLFKNLRDKWGDVKDDIDYSDLSGFDKNKYKGTVIDQEAKMSLDFCLQALSDGAFPREDYKELVQLTIVWLGGKDKVAKFKFQWPGAFHHARFMSKALYILKMDLLRDQLSFLTPEHKDQVSQLARFVGIYFSKWFLKCAIVPSAPYQTLLYFKQMIDFSEFDIGLAFTVLDSLFRHTWYLTEQWIIVCIVDDECPDVEKEAVAKALCHTPRADRFSPGKPELPADFWPETGRLPSLDSFVGPNSWLLPHLLGLDSESMEWLQLSAQQWPLMSGFRKFSELVKKLTIVNDPAERGVKLIQDFVNTTQDEDIRQWRMLSGADQRKKHSKNMTKEDMKAMKRKIVEKN